MKKHNLFIRLVFISIFVLISVSVQSAEHVPLDKDALKGLDTVRTIYDVRTKEPGRLLFALKVIQETARSIRAQAVEPDFVVSFRGGTLPLLRSDPATSNDAHRAMLKEVRERLAVMQTAGMTLEACNVAATALEVKEEELIDEVALIGNSLISLAGYQNKGYALVPMY